MANFRLPVSKRVSQWDENDINQLYYNLKNHGPYKFEWDSETGKSITMGDRLFLQRAKADKTGIFAMAVALEPPNKVEHWDEKKRKKGLKVFRIIGKIELCVSLDNIISYEFLTERFPEVHWRNQQCTSKNFTDVMADELEDMLRKRQNY